jgi:hypothetical protein
VKIDVELHRGIWITGRVTDKVTGQPQFGRIHYFPFRTNPYTKRVPEISRPGGPEGDDDASTGPGGIYRLVGVPGPALVGVECMSGEYRKGAGLDAIKGLQPKGKDHPFRNQVYARIDPSPRWPNLVKEIDPPAGTASATCDFVLDPGGSIRFDVVDVEGKPVSGYTVDGRSADFLDDQPHESPSFDAVNFSPGESRKILIHHAGRNIGRALQVTYDAKQPRSMTARLEPYATLTGRAVDPDGVPLRGLQVEVTPVPDLDFSHPLPLTTTDKDGRFRQPNVPAGLTYHIVLRPGYRDMWWVSKTVAVEAGKTTDLGTLTAKSPN